jgi:hypothetical protein
MRQQLDGQAFQRLSSVGSGRTYGGMDLGRVRFDSCALAQHDDPALGLVVRDVTVTRGSAANCSVHGVRFEDVTVDGLSLAKLHQLAGCVFRHVTLKGRIGPLMTVPVHYSLPEELQAAFNAAAEAYYRDVDWALDISEAEFSDADFYLVPGHLVRRDPRTQFLLHRDVVERTQGMELPTYAGISVSRFETTPFDSLVAIAPKRSKNFERYLEDFEYLRKAGLAE